MKKILLAGCLLLTVLSLHAQEHQSFLMLNIEINNSRIQPFVYGAWNFNSYNSSVWRRPLKPIGIQYIRQRSKHTALRFGFSVSEKYLYHNFSHMMVGDTSINRYTEFHIVMPKISVGKEWQKYIHRDICFYGGFDLGFGIMNSNFKSYEYSNPPRPGNFSTSPDGSTLAINVSSRPFMGLRVCWGRFAAGYEASLPFHYTSIVKEGIHNFEEPRLHQQLNFGFRINNRKRK